MLERIVVFIFGTCIGSFLNVCIYRMPKDKSVVTPGSLCCSCNTPIKWYDNIPILSFILLRGKCRSCKERISFRYPVVEIITGAVFLILYIQLGFGIELLKYCFLFSLLVVVSFIDIDYHAIPVQICFFGIIVGLAFSLYSSVSIMKTGVFDLRNLPVLESAKGLIFGLGFTYLFKLFGDIFITFYLNLRKKESIEGEKESLGLGDVDFMGMVGVFLGIKLTILVFFLAPFFAIIYSVFALIFKKSHLIPYLPYLSLATLAAYFWGSKILGFLF